MKMTKAIATAAVVFAAGALLADTWTDANGITWTYTVSGGKVELCNGPSGSGSTQGAGYLI